jgi:CHAT domain-containing protein
MFAWLQERRTKSGRDATTATLLALGDPAFKVVADASPEPKSNPTPSPFREATFTPLPGTRREVLSISRLFAKKPRLLLGADASEQKLDELAASGGLRQFRYVHFATHGVLDDSRPMQSALILAQDRRPDPLDEALGKKEAYPGRLTAEQILRGWKLDAELVSLSACNSGLGKYRDGEGYLGFSQALFLSGARSLVLSLWQVDDAATALLMTRFYENLLGTPDNPQARLSKAEALAEAKRWLRGLSVEEVRQLSQDLPARGTRGRFAPAKPGTEPAAPPRFEHPYYWAGFILIGDPQ